jgi:flagellar M-ring protein FliF
LTVNGILESLRNLGAGRLLALGAVGFGLLGFFFYLVTRLTAPDFALLYGDLPMNDSSAIVSQLEGLAVPYKIVGNGSQILVPSDQVSRLRLSLAEQGLPSGGSVGYEIFDGGDKLGSTRFVQNVNLVRALEGELARTIGELDRVRAARVHLVLPRRELFQRQNTEPSASVFLRTNGSARPAQAQIAAIQHLVSAAVPGLAPERVAIVDGRGNLLASGAEDRSEFGHMANRADEMRRTYELQVKQTLEQLLERSLGTGRVRAEVSAVVNFDRITSNAEVYDPDGQVVRSTQSIEETSASADRDGSVSVGNNLPDGASGSEAGGTQSNENRTEETVNFEISRTVRSHVQEGGKIERLSIAILVDGSYLEDADSGDRTYQERSETELEQIASLVRSAVGFDVDRGDTIEVINMRFQEPQPIEIPEEPLFGLKKSDYIKIAEIMVLAVVAILVILLVLRPLVTRLFAIQIGPGPDAAGDVIVGPQGQPMLAGPDDGSPLPEGAAIPDLQMQAAAGGGAVEGGGDGIDLSDIEGRVQSSSVKKMGEIIDKHPDEALSILRGWMAQPTH